MLRFQTIEHLRLTCARFGKQWSQRRRTFTGQDYFTSRRIAELGDPYPTSSEDESGQIKSVDQRSAKSMPILSKVEFIQSETSPFNYETSERCITNFQDLSISDQGQGNNYNIIAAVSGSPIPDKILHREFSIMVSAEKTY